MCKLSLAIHSKPFDFIRTTAWKQLPSGQIEGLNFKAWMLLICNDLQWFDSKSVWFQCLFHSRRPVSVWPRCGASQTVPISKCADRMRRLGVNLLRSRRRMAHSWCERVLHTIAWLRSTAGDHLEMEANLTTRCVCADCRTSIAAPDRIRRWSPRIAMDRCGILIGIHCKATAHTCG